MKRKFFKYQSLVIAFLVSTVSLQTTAWGQESSMPEKPLFTVREDVSNPDEGLDREDEQKPNSPEQPKQEDTEAPTVEGNLEDTEVPAEEGLGDTQEPIEKPEDVVKPEVLVPAEKIEKPIINNLPLTLVPTVETSRPEGTYQSFDIIYVMITAPEGYSIFYSLDGSKATESSTLFTKPFAIEAPDASGGKVTLHAIAIRQISEPIQEDVREKSKEESKEESNEDSTGETEKGEEESIDTPKEELEGESQEEEADSTKDELYDVTLQEAEVTQ